MQEDTCDPIVSWQTLFITTPCNATQFSAADNSNNNISRNDEPCTLIWNYHGLPNFLCLYQNDFQKPVGIISSRGDFILRL
jgi:hypothetical protein